MSVPLSSAIKDVVARMMGGGVTGNDAVRERMRLATNGELMAWSRDPMLKEPGLEMWLDAIADEMELRIVAAESKPLKVTIVDYGAKGQNR